MDDEVVKVLTAIADFVGAEITCKNREVDNEPISPRCYDRGKIGVYNYTVKEKP